MQRLTGCSILACLLTLAVIASTEKNEKVIGAGKSTRFISRKYGFSTPIPMEWFVAVSGDTPFYFNFKPDAAPGQGELPKGGATINITAQEELPSRRGRETMEDWAQADEDQGITATISERMIHLPLETGIGRALWTSFDLKRYRADEQAQHQINVYWQFRDKLFATHLLFINGSVHSSELENLLEDIMRGVRPIRKN